MADQITLTAAVRANLLSLQDTQGLIARTQNRLSTGLRVASPLDDGRAFFEVKALRDRATDIAEKKDGIDQAISAVKVTLETVEAVDSLIKQMKGLAIGAKSATGTELTSIVAQYNELRTQIDNLVNDASYQGINLVNSTTSQLNVEFSTDTASVLTITGVNIGATSGLSIASAGLSDGTNAVATFTVAANIDSALAELDVALSTLRGNAQALGSRIALLQTRLGGAMDAAPDLLVGQQPEPALDLVQQEALVGVKWACQRGRLAKPVADRLGLVGPVVVHDDVDVEISRDVRLDEVEEFAELSGPMARETFADDLSRGDVEGREERGRAVALDFAAPPARGARPGTSTISRKDPASSPSPTSTKRAPTWSLFRPDNSSASPPSPSPARLSRPCYSSSTS